MNPDFEETVRGSLQLMVSNVEAEPDGLAQLVTGRVATTRRRKRSLLTVTGVVTAVCVAVAAPVVVLRHTADTSLHPAAPDVSSQGSTAAAYGQRLISMVQLPNGGTSAASAPVRWLRNPPWTTSFSPKPVAVTRWWTYNASAESVWAWVSHHKSPGLGWEGTSGSGFPVPPDVRPPVASVELEPTAGLPPSFLYGDVQVAVAALGPNRAAVGEFATVEARPSRSAAEHVPTVGVQAVVSWRLTPGGTLVHKTLTGPAACRLAAGFDALPRDTRGVHGCPVLVFRNDVVVIFHAAGNTWRVTLDGCADVGVTTPGGRLDGLEVSSSEATGGPPGIRLFEDVLKADGVRIP